MRVEMWQNFTKKKNSTKRPSSAGGTFDNIRLKENCSIESPVFLMQDFDVAYNYILWNLQYYYITDIVYVSNNLFEIHCEKDYLATHKTAIGDYNCFIERSASDYNTMINDPLISKEQRIVQQNTATTDINSWSNTGVYIVRVAGRSGIDTFALSESQLNDLLDYGYDGVLEDLVDDFLKEIFNPFQYILDVKWFPIDRDSIGDGLTNRIYLGKYKYQANSSNIKYIKSLGHYFNGGINTGNDYYSDFRNNTTNFTNIKLDIPSVGLVDIDPSDAALGIAYIMYADYITGNSTVYLYHSTSVDKHFASFSGKIGIDVPIAQLRDNASSTLKNLVGATSNALAGNITGTVGSMLDVYNSWYSPTVSSQSIGSGGKVMLLQHNKFVLNKTYQASASIPTTQAGRPLCANRTIKNLSGFVKCGNASIDLAGESVDKDIVNNYLNSGFYYE